MRRLIIAGTLVLLGALTAVISVSVYAQLRTVETDVRVAARPLADGRIEFAIEHNGERVSPRVRYLSPRLIRDRVGDWLRSSPVTLTVELEADGQPSAGVASFGDGRHAVGTRIVTGTYETTVPTDTICRARRYLPDGTYITNVNIYNRDQEVPLQPGTHHTIEVTERFTYIDTSGGCTWRRVASQPANSEPESGSSLANPLVAGSTARAGDWQVRALSTNPDAWPLIRAESRFNGPPEPGTQYFIVEVEVTYLGAESATPFLDVEIGAIGAGRVVRTDDCGVVPNDYDDYRHTEMFTGGSIRANICYPMLATEVSAGNIVLQVKDRREPNVSTVYLALD